MRIVPLRSESIEQKALALTVLDRSWGSARVDMSLSDRALGVLGPQGMAWQAEPIQGLIRLAEHVEQDGALRAKVGAELLYHNRQHVHDVLRALSLLFEVTGPIITAQDRYVLVLAMVAHDLGHEGLPNQFARQLERQSWALIEEILSSFALGRGQRWMARAVILCTDPQFYPQLMSRDRSGRLMQAICLAVDADLFASLLPSYGFERGARLGAEQMAAGIAAAKGFKSLAGRAMFLKSVPLLSDAVQNLGMARLVAAQLAVIASLGDEERARPWSEGWGTWFAEQVALALAGDR
jgi:hypothetical protein